MARSLSWTIRHSLRTARLLQDAGREVIEAATGQAAVDAYVRERPDAVLDGPDGVGFYILLSVESKKQRLFVNYAIDITDA